MCTKTCTADFTINGQSGNQAFNNSDPITLRADDLTATTYAWSVTAVPTDATYQLEANDQAEAQLTLLDPGSFVVQLLLEKDACQACARHLVWFMTPQRQYRLPANGELLRFDGDAEWHGDLIKVIKDVDATLPLPQQKEALDAANAPATENPFATMADLPIIPIIPNPQLTPEQETAVDYANNPNAENPFATLNDLPEAALTPEQKAAIENADNPSGANPFLTHNDVAVFTHLVPRAAGCIELDSDITPAITLGNLRLTEIDRLNGRFTLTFDGYNQARKVQYIVNALTVHDHPTTLNRIYNVELVRFSKDGITFHMSRFPGSQAALAPRCMVEVREII